MTNTDVAVQQQRESRPPMVVLRERFQDRKGELKNSLPSDITPDEFIRAVMTSTALNPKIMACSWQSIWNACLQACRDGLLPDGVDGALVPFKSRCNWIPMYQGLLRRFRRSGQFKWITAGIVREGDEFEHYIDEGGEHFRHVPGYDSDRPMAKAYALATTKEGGVFVSVMTAKEIAKRRNMSRATRDDSPWKMWGDEMTKKTMLRQLSKVLPSARDIIAESDELPAVEGPGTSPLTPYGEAVRAHGPAATLDHFASASAAQSVDDTPAAGTGAGGEQSTEGQDEPAADEVAAAATSAAPPSDDSAAAVDLIAAFKRGQADKSKGAQRRAMPPEYREQSRTRESLCWLAGYDGQQLPTFKD